jgi:hypothetical protein
MKKATNLKLHMMGGFAAGFLGAILKPDDSNPEAKLRFAFIGSIVWLLVTLVWEIWQWKQSKMTLRTYWREKGEDTLMDLMVGNMAFLLPFWILTMGEYQGNRMRP